MSERQAGWYHVKDERGFWQCAQWNGYAWHGVFVENGFDDYWQEIGPCIPTPDEPWQLVPVELIDWIRGAQRLMRALPEGGGWPAAANQADRLLAAAPKPGGE